MSVDGIEFMYCLRCKRHTAHSTHWDASRPDRLDTDCMECTYHRADGTPSDYGNNGALNL